MRASQNNHFLSVQEYIKNEQSTIKHDLKKNMVFVAFKKFSQHLLLANEVEILPIQSNNIYWVPILGISDKR